MAKSLSICPTDSASYSNRPPHRRASPIGRSINRGTDMQKRTLITLISVASLLALAAVLIFSWTQVTQAQARGQQNANRAPADGGRGIVNGGAETNSESVPAPPGWKPCPRCQNNAD